MARNWLSPRGGLMGGGPRTGSDFGPRMGPRGPNPNRKDGPEKRPRSCLTLARTTQPESVRARGEPLARTIRKESVRARVGHSQGRPRRKASALVENHSQGRPGRKASALVENHSQGRPRRTAHALVENHSQGQSGRNATNHHQDPYTGPGNSPSGDRKSGPHSGSLGRAHVSGKRQNTTPHSPERSTLTTWNQKGGTSVKIAGVSGSNLSPSPQPNVVDPGTALAITTRSKARARVNNRKRGLGSPDFGNVAELASSSRTTGT